MKKAIFAIVVLSIGAFAQHESSSDGSKVEKAGKSVVVSKPTIAPPPSSVEFPLTGQWAGTATITDSTGTETVSVSGAFIPTTILTGQSGTNQSVIGAVVFTEPSDIPQIYAFTFTMAGSVFIMSESGGAAATGSISTGIQGTTISAMASDDVGGDTSASGTLTLVANGMTSQGTITELVLNIATGMYTPTTQTFSGTLQINPNGTLTGSAIFGDGTTAAWTADKQ